jgi:hypothetical protein
MAADLAYDEERRAWIAAHAGIWMFQKRRAEILAKRIRARSRATVGARPDPHDDQVTPAVFFRTSTTTTGAVEYLVVTAAVVLAPLGWPAGRLLSGLLVRLIPDRLQSYPIVALAWAAVISGLPLPLLYNPAPTLTSIVLIAWFTGQLPAAFAAAACYGILDGWLAIDGASSWWPLEPAQREVNAALILGPAPVVMPTLLDPPRSATRPDAPRVPRRRPAPINWWMICTPLAAYALGTLWYVARIATEFLSHSANAISAR